MRRGKMQPQPVIWVELPLRAGRRPMAVACLDVSGQRHPLRFAGLGIGLLAMFVMFWAPARASAQTLRYDMHREIEIPEYALLRIGPFYSDVTFRQSAGYRWTSSRGAGTDFMRAGRRGRIREDGSDFPLISTLDFRNRLLISRRADVDLSLRLQYEHYPLNTQDDQFIVDLPDEGIIGNFSTSFQLTPFVRGTIYDRIVYRTDWVDARGLLDESAGRKYVYLDNILGINADWRLASDKNVSLSASRQDHWPQSREFKDQQRTTHRESAAYAQEFRPYLSGGVRAEFSQTEYAAATRSDFDSQLYSLFADVLLTRRVTASGWVGYAITTVRSSEAGGERSRDGMQWGGTLKGDEAFWIGFPELKHELGASRTVSESFNSAYQSTDRYFYRLMWDGLVFKAGAGVERSEVEPSDRRVNAYDDTNYYLYGSYPLTTFARVTARTGYRIRRNDLVTSDAVVDEEWRHDYETWYWRVGTAFAVTRKLDFDTFYQHHERLSDEARLQYERDVFQAMFTYSHRF